MNGAGHPERGISLVEVLCALVVIGIGAMAILPTFVVHRDSTERNEIRAGAMIAATTVMERLRLDDPAALPTSGASAAQQFDIDGRTYMVVTRYCPSPSLCGTGSRQVVVEVSRDGDMVYELETVFTQLL